MLFSTAVLGIFNFDTCHLLGVKEARVETRLVPSFCFQRLLRENETSVSFHITGFRCSFFWRSSKRTRSFSLWLTADHRLLFLALCGPTSPVMCVCVYVWECLSFSLFWCFWCYVEEVAVSRSGCGSITYTKLKPAHIQNCQLTSCDSKICFRNSLRLISDSLERSHGASWSCFCRMPWSLCECKTFQKFCNFVSVFCFEFRFL